MRIAYLAVAANALLSISCHAQSDQTEPKSGDKLIAEYFDDETRRLTDACLAEIATLDDWRSLRKGFRRQLLEMLGLDPLPARTPLDPVITGTVDHEDVVVERIHFQSLPGLYVTGNFYRPSKQEGPLPAILYVCGHARVKKEGVSLGNKTHYQHHGAWFAKNGYVCLTIDTIQLGEIEGIHHGTYREKMWWWNNRGYTPAGVEAWNCVRALDYLQTREEVDSERLGITGRSGGGAYSWWAAAIDDRIKVAVPVAGITSLKNHVVDGCVEGHCDCMYMVNTYRWDYPMIAALVAPRPLLISNTDKDRIFPLDGVVDVHAKVRRIYELHGAGDNLGLQITEGPHKDTQELRVHAFRWFNRFLKSDEALLESPARPLFAEEDLKVFESLPEKERVTSIHESFVPKAKSTPLPASLAELEQVASSVIPLLNDKTFRGWPETSVPPPLQVISETHHDDFLLREFEFESQPPYRLTLFVLNRERTGESRGPTLVRVLSASDWQKVAAGLAAMKDGTSDIDANPVEWKALRDQAKNNTVVFVVPRGVGPTAWSSDARVHTHIRRRFMQLGQTLAGMQTFDVLRALQGILSSSEFRNAPIQLTARGEATTWALYASLYMDGLTSLELVGLPPTNRQSPDLLNVSRFTEVPTVAMLAAQRIGKLTLVEMDPIRYQSWEQLLDSSALARDLIQLQRGVEPNQNAID